MSRGGRGGAIQAGRKEKEKEEEEEEGGVDGGGETKVEKEPEEAFYFNRSLAANARCMQVTSVSPVRLTNTYCTVVLLLLLSARTVGLLAVVARALREERLPKQHLPDRALHQCRVLSLRYATSTNGRRGPLTPHT